MKISRLFFTFLKQNIKKPDCFLLLLALPALTVLFSFLTKAEEKQILAACYIPGIEASDFLDFNDTVPSFTEDPLTSLARKLYQYDGLYRFYLCDSEQAVYDAVASSRAECGYLFPDNLYQELLSGNLKELVTTVASPSTTMLPVINETVYSLIFEKLAVNSLKQYLTKESAISGYYPALFDDKTIEDLYQNYLLGDSVFHFEYNGRPGEYVFTASSILLSPIRGVLAVLLLLSACSGAVSYYRLSENPVFNTWKVRICSVAIPVLYTMPVMLVCIYFADLGTGIFKELLLLAFYGCACIIYTFLLTLVIKKRVIFTSVLPLLILACLVFTPVFIDISVFVPALKPLSYLFLPYYYLILF